MFSSTPALPAQLEIVNVSKVLKKTFKSLSSLLCSRMGSHYRSGPDLMLLTVPESCFKTSKNISNLGLSVETLI